MPQTTKSDIAEANTLLYNGKNSDKFDYISDDWFDGNVPSDIQLITNKNRDEPMLENLGYGGFGGSGNVANDKLTGSGNSGGGSSKSNDPFAIRDYAEAYGAKVTWLGNESFFGDTYANATIEYDGKH